MCVCGEEADTLLGARPTVVQAPIEDAKQRSYRKDSYVIPPQARYPAPYAAGIYGGHWAAVNRSRRRAKLRAHKARHPAGGTFSYGNAVNSSGQVAGQSNTDPTGSGNGGNQAATLYSGGVLNGISPAFSSANAINAGGQITGIAETSAPGAVTVYQAYIYSTLNGTSTTTYLPSFGGNFNEGFGINNSGQVVGQSAAADQSNRAFLYSNSNLIDLDKILGGGTNFNNSVAYGISNNGKITGSVYGDYAYTYDSETGAVNFLPSLTDPSPTDPNQGFGSVGYSINDSGQVTGYNVTSAGTEHAVFYGSDGTLTDLTPGLADNVSSFGQSINASGQIVGEIVPGGPFTDPTHFSTATGR